MKAAVILGEGDARRLAVEDGIPEPAPDAGEVVVRVRAVGLNRADLMLNASHRQDGPKAAAPVAGLEYAGEVAALGTGVKGLAKGDRVMGFGTAAFAEYTKSDHRLLFRVPDGFSWEKAATYPLAIETMHDAIVTNGRLAKGESILFQGASSGVGLVGMQIAKALGAGTVFGASRSAAKLDAMKPFGMDGGIDISDPSWPDKVREATGGKGVDLIVDMVSGDLMDGNMQAAAVLGRIVNVGRLGGRTAAFNFDLHALKRLTYVGVTFRTRSNDEIAKIVESADRDLRAHIEGGRIGLPIEKVFPLDDITDAYAMMRENRHFGKIVIAV